MTDESSHEHDAPYSSYDDEAMHIPDKIAFATDSDLDEMMDARLAKCRGLQLLRQCADSCPPIDSSDNHTATSPIAIPKPRHHHEGLIPNGEFSRSPQSNAAVASASADLVSMAARMKLEESDLVPRPAHPPPESLNTRGLTSCQWDRPDGLLSPEDVILVRRSIKTVDGIIPTRPSALSVEGWRQLGNLCLERVEALAETYPTVHATWVKKACVNRAKQTMRHAKNAFRIADALEGLLATSQA